MPDITRLQRGIGKYKKILVPLDGSSTSQRALEEAISLAKLCGASVRLVHVVNELILANDFLAINYTRPSPRPDRVRLLSIRFAFHANCVCVFRHVSHQPFASCINTGRFAAQSRDTQPVHEEVVYVPYPPRRVSSDQRMSQPSLTLYWLRTALFLSASTAWAIASGAAAAERETNPASALRARYAAFYERLEQSPFLQQLEVESFEDARAAGGTFIPSSTTLSPRSAKRLRARQPGATR